MKKITLTTALIGGYIATAYAGEKNTDAMILNIFKVALNSSGNAEWIKKHNYHKSTLLFNGREISAYYIGECSVVGFSYRLINTNDLPQEVLNCIKGRYKDCIIQDAIIFMDRNGRVNYYAGVKQQKTYIALKISSTCRISIMKKISIKVST